MEIFDIKAKRLVKRFLSLFAGLEQLKVSEMISHIVNEIEYESFISQYEDIYEVEKRMDNINELINAAVQMEESRNITLSEFLSTTTLQTSSDEDTHDMVKLMTIHSSKGLEFDTVFLTGLEEGVFPLLGQWIMNGRLRKKEGYAMWGSQDPRTGCLLPTQIEGCSTERLSF